MLISIAIPCYKSSKTLPGVVEEIVSVFDGQDAYDYEIILVNDGSPDNTFEVIHNLCQKNSKIIGVNLSKNFGQAAAKASAVNYVNGDIMIYMDDDGQHPAEGIFLLAEKVREGNDVVYAHFPQKRHSLFKRITSNLHSWVMVKTGAKDKDTKISSFQAFSSFAINAVKTSETPTVATGRYVRMVTSKTANVILPHRERKEGKSNYTISKLVKKWINAVTSFNVVALRLAVYFGLFFGVFGLLGAIFLVILKLMRPNMAAGYASTMAITLVVGGLIMFLIGILGEYIGKIYLMICKLPAYKVRTVLNSKAEESKK